MRINVVTKTGWILERLARELVEHVPGVRLNAGQDERTVDPHADFNYYLPAKDLRKYPTDGPAIGFYTHGEHAFDLIPSFAVCLAMNKTMGARLEAHGAADVRIIRPGTDAPQRPIVFGVIGRTYNDGRKGEALVANAVADGFRFVACGTEGGRGRALTRRQWPCPTPYTIATRDAFYAAIDYLVVTSSIEGGPMTVLEAVARGVPIIAPPTVGWCGEFPIIPYDVGQYDSLRSVLYKLTHPPTWDEWAEQHGKLFEVLNGKALQARA